MTTSKTANVTSKANPVSPRHVESNARLNRIFVKKKLSVEVQGQIKEGYVLMVIRTNEWCAGVNPP